MLKQEHIEILSAQQHKKNLINNRYLIDENNPNFQYIREKFFHKDIKKTKLLNTGSGLFTAISNIISAYVGSPNIDIEFPTKLLVEDYACLGYAVCNIQRQEGKLNVNYLPGENYIRISGQDVIVRAYILEENNETIYYYLLTIFNGGIIENKLYKTKNINFEDFREVELDELETTSNLQPIIDTGLEKCFFVIQEDELDLDKISLIEKVENIVYSIDRKIAMFDTQFLLNVESFVLLKGIDLPTKLFDKYNKEGKLNFSDLGRYLTTQQDGKIEFVNNQNVLLDKAIQYEQEQINKISTITTIPRDFLGGMGTSGAIGEGSRNLLHGAFIKTITRIRELFDKSITEIIDIIKTENDIEDLYSWDDVFSKDTKQLVDELDIALRNKLISQRSGIKRYLGYTDEEIDLEIKQIEDENNIGQNTSNDEGQQKEIIIQQ